MLLLLSDTIASLAIAARLRATEVRTAKIAGSKNNFDYLVNAGVIITEDDAFDAEMTRQGLTERAKKNGTTFDQEKERMHRENAEDSVRSTLRETVRMGETYAERSVRVNAILAQAEGTKTNGKPCSHTTTKKEQGWINSYGGYNMEAPMPGSTSREFTCCRCCAKVIVEARTGEPTEQAVIAAAILAKESVSRDDLEIVLQLARDGVSWTVDQSMPSGTPWEKESYEAIERVRSALPLFLAAIGKGA